MYSCYKDTCINKHVTTYTEEKYVTKCTEEQYVTKCTEYKYLTKCTAKKKNICYLMYWKKNICNKIY